MLGSRKFLFLFYSVEWDHTNASAAQGVTFEFGGIFLTATQNLGSFLWMTTRHSVFTKGPPSQLIKGPSLARDSEEVAAGNG